MKISIIIPHYFGRASLDGALSSIRAQRHAVLSLEILVVVDHSRGISEEVKKKFDFVKWIEFKSHIGTAKAKNAGAEAAQGDWLVFLDDDVDLHPYWLEGMANAARQNPQSPCFQSKVLFQGSQTLNSAGGVANLFGYSWDRGVFEEDVGQFDHDRSILFATSCAMMISKKMFTHIGGFDEDFFYMGEDYDVGLRLYLAGESVRFVPEAVCYHTRSSDEKEQRLHSKYYLERNRMLVLLKNYPWPLLLKILFLLPFIKAAKYGAYLFRFKKHRFFYFKEIVRGWGWVLIHLPAVLKKRRSVAAIRKQSLQQVFSSFAFYRDFLGSVQESVVKSRVPMMFLPRLDQQENESPESHEANRRLS